MTKLEKIEEKIFDARDKKYRQKKNWNFSDWICTQYMTKLSLEWEQAKKEQEEKTGVRVDYNFGDLLC
tara:strand:- start:479 stop:682 length:204 start_codon:yes stop_codon:yes gene_type:complete